MRLIDADELLEFLTNHMDFLVPANTEKLTQCEIKEIIHKQPTVYDVKKEIRTQAIDEFVEELKNSYKSYPIYRILDDNNMYSHTTSCCILEEFIDDIAKQMKGGVAHE